MGEAERHLARVLTDAEARAEHVQAPEDEEVAVLCERIGYGAVMDAAMRLWLRKDSDGAFIIGGSAAGVRSILWRAMDAG